MCNTTILLLVEYPAYFYVAGTLMCYIMTCSISKVLLRIFFMWYDIFSQLFSCFSKFVTGNVSPLALWILLDEEITQWTK